MKKAKMMLIAIVVLAVAGGIMAFKSQKFGFIIYTPDANGICDVALLDHYTTDSPFANGVIVWSASLNSTTTTCDLTYVIFQP
jgi:hypothetical protein